MMNWLMVGIGFAGGFWLATRNKWQAPIVHGQAAPAGDNERSRVHWASSAYGAGSASLEPPPQPTASTMFSAGTASLPFEQQAIRDPDTVR